MTLGKLFNQSSFNATQRQVVILAISRYNECRYCVAAHSAVAQMQSVPADVVEAIRTDKPIADSRLESLRKFATLMVDKRGWPEDAKLASFLAAGYTRAHVLEVILAISYKTLSNYVNHVAGTPLDDAFAAKVWSPEV